MRKNLTIFFIAASLAIILDSFGIWKIILEFFFIGVVPGSENRFEPYLMLMLISSVTGIVIGNFFVLPFMRKYNPIFYRKN